MLGEQISQTMLLLPLGRQWVNSFNKAFVSGGVAEWDEPSRNNLFRQHAEASLHISGTPCHVPP